MAKIKDMFAKYRRQIIIVVSSILVLLSMINFYYLFNVTAQSNDECLWIPQTTENGEQKILFDVVKVDGVTWEAGIRDGDQFIALDGVKLETIEQATVLLDYYDSDEYASYKVMRDGEMFITDVRIKKLINFPGLGLSLLGIIWLMVSFIVVMAKSESKTQRLFFKIGVAATLMSFFNFLSRGSLQTNPVMQYLGLVIFFDVMWTLGSSYFTFLIIRFFLVFPKPYKIMDKKGFANLLIYAPLFVFSLSMIYRILFVYNNNFFAYGNILFFHFGQVILASILCLFILARSYRRIEAKGEKKAILIILLSSVLGVASIIFTVFFANVLADTIFNSPQYFMPIILVAIIPVAFGFSIFRYSLMDISDVVKNAIIYSTATVTLAGSYFLIIYLIGQSVSQAIGTEYRSIIAGGVFIVFAMIFQSTKDRFQVIITKRFYPEQFAFHKVMMQFSNDVTGIVGLENILDSAHKTFVESLKLEKFGIALYDEHYDDYKLLRTTGLPDDAFFIKENPENIAAILEQKKIIRQLPVIEQSEFAAAFPLDYEKLYNAEFFTVIPIIIKSKIIGFLLFGLKYSGSQFAGKDLELLVASTNQLAVSIENARLYESEAERMKLEQDLNNARKIQEGLLPKQIPEIIGADICGRMIPATYVGGDYYDVIKISPKRFFVVIGDVSGKGLSASLYMSKLQTMMSLYCTEERSPKEILVEINKRMYQSIEKNWFITVSLGLFDLEKMSLTYSRAGHTPLLWVEDAKVLNCQSKGIGVGLESGTMFDSSLEVAEISLKTGQQFVFYSDGVNELMNNKNELFGVERLESIMTSNGSSKSSEKMNSILDSLNSFRGKTPQYDDITLVVVNIN